MTNSEDQHCFQQLCQEMGLAMSAVFQRGSLLMKEGTPLEITSSQVRRQIAVIEECHKQNPLPQMQ
jgi:hypothetical protein